MTTKSARQRLLATSIICGAMATAWADTALAQTAAAGASEVGEIVVTGSRIRRDTFSSPSPLSVVSAESIRESGQVSMGDLLLDQPNIGATTNPQNSNGNLFLAGQQRADIRGLGPSRTLILMDGRRLPFSDGTSPAVDLNTIPSLMVERIETITGGASAVYGSEAIAGVLNFIMKKKHDGLEIDLQAGVTEHGDGEEFRGGFNFGRSFLDGRLSVLVGGEYAKQDVILQKDRDELYPGIRRDTRLSAQTILPQSRANTGRTPTFQLVGGALGTARAVTLDYRDPTKVVRLSAACSTPTVQPDCQDEALFYSQVYNALQGKSDRAVLRTYVNYELTQDWNAFVDASYVLAHGYSVFQPTFSSITGGGIPVTFRGDNAFLNGAGATAAALRAEWLAAGKTLTQGSTAPVGKFWEELGLRNAKTEREQYRIAGGFEGKLQAFGRDLNVDAYVQNSKLDGTINSLNQPYKARLQQATDAILVNGQVVCREVAARTAGCVPWDMINGPSREAVLWVNANASLDQTVSQTVAAFNVASSVFDLPAGPVGVAFGAEYRRESMRTEQDPIAAANLLFINQIGTTFGAYSAREAYGEVRIPLLKDVPFAEELTVELAGRLADYTTVGRAKQYRLHAMWSPVRDVRFRLTQSTAVRAPNIVELYSPQFQNFTATAIDPCDKDVYRGATAAQKAARNLTCAAAISGWNPETFISNIGTGRSSLSLLQGGNPNVKPETAHTWEYGVVIQPRWIPNLQLSLDYFKYNVDGLIGTVNINTLFQQLCHDSSAAYASNPFCAQIRRDPTGGSTGGTVGGVSVVTLVNENLASTKVEGYDYAIQYGFQTEDVFGKDYGAIAMRLDATWMYRFITQSIPGDAYVQFANSITNATPEWKASASVRWSNEKASLVWSTSYIGSMRSTTALQPNQLAPYMTGDYFRHDLRGTYKLNDDISFRAGVINLFDRYPPALPETFTGTGTGSSQFDNRGRFFFIGANMNF